MKLATFATASAHPRVGLVVSEGIVDVRAHLEGVPDDMPSFIEAHEKFDARLKALEQARVPDFTMDQVRLLAPVLRPGKILGIGLNYADHIREGGHAMPTEQMWFSKAVTSVQDPFGTIALPRVSEQLDYEAELVFVVGRRCRHVTAELAAEVIFGYCAGNDVSVRDWQRKPTQHMLGKSFDTHAPFGPWIVTADELSEPHALGIRCLVNGELRQDSNTRELVFDCYDQVAYLSQVMTLEPGDVIFTGTPGGVGFARKPQVFLKAGDRVRVEIEGIGAVENEVVRDE